jgi:hypothetical protein
MTTNTVTPIRAARRPSMTADTLLLSTERLHRVDASQLPHGAGVALGYCRTDMGVCMGHPACADTHCPGHPCNDTDAQAGHDTPDDAGQQPSTGPSEDRAMQMLAGLLVVAGALVAATLLALAAR